MWELYFVDETLVEFCMSRQKIRPLNFFVNKQIKIELYFVDRNDIDLILKVMMLGKSDIFDAKSQIFATSFPKSKAN